MSAPKWAVGMRKLGPGIYVTADGDAHLDAREICESLGCPPTPANLAIAEQAAANAFREAYPDLPITRVEEQP